MPIYAYKCESCGHAKDVLQKMSDAPLIDCPSCGAPALKKQLTAAGFQLKGSGWYVTDFRDGKGGGDKAKDVDKAKESAGSDKVDAPLDSGSIAPATGTKTDDATSTTSTASTASTSAPVTSPARAPEPASKAAP